MNTKTFIDSYYLYPKFVRGFIYISSFMWNGVQNNEKSNYWENNLDIYVIDLGLPSKKSRNSKFTNY